MPAAIRNLRVLRIDDDLNAMGGENRGPQYATERAPDHLESVEVDDLGASIPGIRSWAGALTFWKAYEAYHAIDLIIADVSFYDRSSPLNAISRDAGRTRLPTGLCHFKSFAAVARAQARPLGVGIHTREAQVWREYGSSEQADLQFIGLLAAHEIGEIAAILREAGDLPDGSPESCWRWLEARTIKADDFRKAIPPALAQYRRRLLEMRLLPKDYLELVAWCGHMGGAADADAALPLTEERDPGFPIVGTDGRRDPVSIRSLFADVPLRKGRFEFKRVGLPKQCYDLREDPLAHELDQDNNPRIGALVYASGSLTRDYEAALAMLAHLPVFGCLPAAHPLTDLKRDMECSHMAAALAIFLQEVRRLHAIHHEWEKAYRERKWNALHDRYDSDSNYLTMREWLARIYAATPENQKITREDVFDLVDASDAGIDEGYPGALRCLRMLTEMKALRQIGSSNAYERGPRAFSTSAVPRFPNPPPAGFFGESDLGPAFSEDLNSLADSRKALSLLIGHDTADGVVDRQIFQAFGGGRGDGTKVMNAFREGRGPAWLKELCRDHARDVLGWTDTDTWPPALLD
jgi:hypothetical protein